MLWVMFENIDIVFFFVYYFKQKACRDFTKNSQTISMEIPWEAAAFC